VEPAGERREQMVAWLRDRDPQQVTTVETHLSVLGFQGDRVYKCKKDVRFPFVDLSTPEQRLADCEREVALNRRLAPDVYLGVESISTPGEPPEPVVVMRRLPGDRRLGTLDTSPEHAGACIDRVAALLARFHAGAATGRDIDRAATRESVAAAWDRELADIREPVDARVAVLVHRYLAGRAGLFDSRIRAGRARDGHGDLLADDVFCLADGPRVLDCLEFDDRLRYGDVLADAAFLAMDLERLGAPDLARRFLDAYRECSGDDWPRSLEHLYVAYRALVRAKVAAIGGDHASARYRLDLVLTHLEAGRVRLVLVGGPPATGKTTLARAIGRATGWNVLHSDEVRKELAGIAPATGAPAPLGRGIYMPEWTARTYTALMDRARELLGHGHSVVLDATFSEPAHRDAAARVAAGTSSELVAFRCAVAPAVAAGRAARRAAAARDASDADAKVAAARASGFVPWPQALPLETGEAPQDEVAAAALAIIGPA
jgi:aminoglycoside phosphotransferase family enzyme/predicted kinase